MTIKLLSIDTSTHTATIECCVGEFYQVTAFNVTDETGSFISNDPIQFLENLGLVAEQNFYSEETSFKFVESNGETSFLIFSGDSIDVVTDENMVIKNIKETINYGTSLMTNPDFLGNYLDQLIDSVVFNESLLDQLLERHNIELDNVDQQNWIFDNFQDYCSVKYGSLGSYGRALFGNELNYDEIGELEINLDSYEIESLTAEQISEIEYDCNVTINNPSDRIAFYSNSGDSAMLICSVDDMINDLNEQFGLDTKTALIERLDLFNDKDKARFVASYISLHKEIIREDLNSLELDDIFGEIVSGGYGDVRIERDQNGYFFELEIPSRDSKTGNSVLFTFCEI